MDTTLSLWRQFSNWKEKYTWVDLSPCLSVEMPQWSGWPDMVFHTMMDLDVDHIFRTYNHTLTKQHETLHPPEDHSTLEQIMIEERLMPLCVINCSKKVNAQPDYMLTKEDILQFEKRSGKIPENAFVIFQSGYGNGLAKEYNNSSAQDPYLPGWSLDAISFLVEQRNVGGFGYETSSPKMPVSSVFSNSQIENYISDKDMLQLALLSNVDQCPPIGGLIFCTLPKTSDHCEFPARYFALIPKD